MTTKRPLSYLGVDSPNPPRVVTAARAPAATDYNGYVLGDIWINTAASTSYILTSKAGGTSTWGITTPGASDVDTINSLAPVAGDIVIAGGTNITDVNAGNTVTLNLDDAITLATSVSSPIYTSATDIAITAITGKDIDIKMGDNAGANNVSFLDSDGVSVFSIDSNGSIGTLAGLTVAGAFAQTAGTFNVGQDNAANAINIGGGNVARAIAIGSTGAHTLNIGNAAAGAIAVDTAAGISLDAATASNFTVTGAADLTLASTAGSISMSAGEAAVDAISLNASNGAGGVTIAAGTGGLNFGNQADCTTIGLGDFAPTASRTISIGGGTVVTAAVTDTIDVGPDGATTNANSVKTVNVNTGSVTLGQVLTNIATGAITSGTHTVSIQSGNAAAGTVATNISTGTGTKTVNLGNADALTTCNIDAITLINDSVNAATSINTGTSTGTVSIGNALSGAIAVSGGAAVTVDAVGVLELNSSAGVISVGNDAVAQNINVGTGAAARTVTIGNTTGASSVVVDVGTGAASFGASATAHTTTVGSTTGASALVLQSGTGDITVTGTVKEINAEFLTRSGVDITCSSSPIVQSNANTGAAPTGATGDVNLLMFQEGFVLREFVKGAEQTIIAPRADATGLLVSGDLTATEGYEINADASRANAPLSFTIGTSPAFFAEISFTVADVSGCEPMYFGFRKTQADAADYTTYTDFVGYGLNNLVAANDCIIATNLNNAGVSTTDTNDAWADAATHTLQVLVSAAGVVTFTFDGSAPTVTQAFTFDNGDVVHFWYTHVFGAGAPGTIHWNSLKVGYQA